MREDMRLVQTGLKWLGHDSGPIDGLWGKRTGAAVLIGALGWGYWAAVAGFAIWGAALAISTWRRM